MERATDGGRSIRGHHAPLWQGTNHLPGRGVGRKTHGVYRVMIRLGLLEPPERVAYSTIKGTVAVWDNEEHKALARKITQESIVLLKNELVKNAVFKNAEHLLPLHKSEIKSVAVIGPYADVAALDWYSGTPPYAVSALDGIKQSLGENVRVSFAHDNSDGAAEKIARAADVAIVVVGNHPTCNAGWAKCTLPSDGK